MFLILALLAAGNVLGISGIDLVLPAIPGLPDVLGGSAGRAQMVLASFVAGTGCGLLLFGRLGNRMDQRQLLIISLFLYGCLSLLCGLMTSIEPLIILRFLQGASGSAALVFGPGFIRRMLEPAQAVRMIGVIGSIESLVPALAPLVGVFLLQHWGWNSSFFFSAAAAFLLALLAYVKRRSLPLIPPSAQAGSYGKLLRDPVYLRYAISQACVLGGLLTFVFGAPAVLVNSWGGPLSDFIRMQIIGVVSFIVAANSAQKLVARFGTERMISFGTALSACGGLGLYVYALSGGQNPWVLIPLFIPLNVGLGLRGPPGFYRAIVAAKGDDARGAALTVLAIMGMSALGTALVAPFITQGLPVLAGISCGILLLGVLILGFLPALSRDAEPEQ